MQKIVGQINANLNCSLLFVVIFADTILLAQSINSLEFLILENRMMRTGNKTASYNRKHTLRASFNLRSSLLYKWFVNRPITTESILFWFWAWIVRIKMKANFSVPLVMVLAVRIKSRVSNSAWVADSRRFERISKRFYHLPPAGCMFTKQQWLLTTNACTCIRAWRWRRVRSLSREWRSMRIVNIMQISPIISYLFNNLFYRHSQVVCHGMPNPSPLFEITRAVTGTALGLANLAANKNAQTLKSVSEAIPSWGPITNAIKRVVDTGKEAAESRAKLYNDLVLPEKFEPLPYDPTFRQAHVDSPVGYMRESLKQGIRAGLDAKSRHDRRLRRFFTPGNNAPIQPQMMPDTKLPTQLNQNQMMVPQMSPEMLQHYPMQQQLIPEMLQQVTAPLQQQLMQQQQQIIPMQYQMQPALQMQQPTPM